MTTPASTAVEQLSHRWAEAELTGDADALDQLGVDGLTLVGPLGFTLDRTRWLDRFRSGDFEITELAWKNLRIHTHGSTAVVIGTYTQKATYQGNPNHGSFTVSQTWVNTGDRWRIAHIQYSPMAMPPGAPPR